MVGGGGGGLAGDGRGEGGGRERDGDSESGRESKPVLQCPIVDFLSFLLQFDANVSLACCQTTRRLEKTKVMKGFLTQFFLFLTTKTILFSPAFFLQLSEFLEFKKEKSP